MKNVITTVADYNIYCFENYPPGGAQKVTTVDGKCQKNREKKHDN